MDATFPGNEISCINILTGTTTTAAIQSSKMNAKLCRWSDADRCAAAASAIASWTCASSWFIRASVWNAIRAVFFSYRRTARLRASSSGWILCRASNMICASISGFTVSLAVCFEFCAVVVAALSATCASKSSSRAERSRTLLWSVSLSSSSSSAAAATTRCK